MLHNVRIQHVHEAHSDLMDLLDQCKDERTVEIADPMGGVQRVGLAEGKDQRRRQRS
jgi:hypothetical protein